MAGIQLGGLVSGFDTTSMITSLMEAEQLKVDKVQQQKIKMQWQQEAYTAISDKYANFVLKMRDVFGVSNSVSSHGLTRPSAINNLSWVNKAVSSNESILKAKATSAAKPGKYEVEVKQLADSVKVASQQKVAFEGDAKLANLKVDGGTLGEGDFSFKVEVTKDGKTETHQIQLTGESTMSDLAKSLDGIEGISANYDSGVGRLFLQTDETGANNGFKINATSDESKALFDGIGLSDSVNKEFSGSDAIINFNGANDISFSKNTFTIQGVEISLNDVSAGDKVSITVDTDVDSVVEKVQTFVSEYNTLMNDIGNILGESTYRDYSPLTDAQKEDMTDKQIELWEAKAKSGLLRNDSMINSIQQSLKSALLQPVTLSDGSSFSLFDIGIQTKGYSSASSSAELQIDEDKLRAAITSNPDNVLELFFGLPEDDALHTSDRNLSSTQINEKRQQSGLFNRVTDIMTNGISQIITKAGAGDSASDYRKINSFIMVDFTASGSKSLLDNRLTDINKRITTLNNRMTQVEARYWSKFTAMETALSKMQSQMSAFSSF